MYRTFFHFKDEINFFSYLNFCFTFKTYISEPGACILAVFKWLSSIQPMRAYTELYSSQFIVILPFLTQCKDLCYNDYKADV